MRTALKIMFPIACFLLFFSVFRSLNGLEPLTLKGLFNSLSSFELDFDTTVDMLNYFRKLSAEVFQNAQVYDFISFFVWLGKFFNLIFAPVGFLVTFIIDVLDLLRAVFRVIFSLLGFQQLLI